MPDSLTERLARVYGLIAKWRERPEWTMNQQYAADELEAALQPISVTPVPHGYTGPITAGAHFIWQKHQPRAWALLVVTKVETGDAHGLFDEPRVWTQTLSGNGTNRPGVITWNEESYFREVVTPCDAHGTEIRTPHQPRS